MAVNFNSNGVNENLFARLGQIGQSGSYTPEMKLPTPRPQATLKAFAGLAPNYGVTGGTQPSGPLPGGDIGRLMRAIRSQESGGRYQATNPSGATGAYQILWSNLSKNDGSDWDRQALGRDVSYNEFLNTPSIQDAIARYKLNQYMQSRGMAGAAATWYGGDWGYNHMHDRTPQNGYPSMYDYIMSVISKTK